MKKYDIVYRVWIGNELKLDSIEIEAESERDAEQQFVAKRHFLPVEIKELEEP